MESMRGVTVASIAALVGLIAGAGPSHAGPDSTAPATGAPGAAPAPAPAPAPRRALLGVAIRVGYVRYTAGGSSTTAGFSLRLGVRIPRRHVAVVARLSTFGHFEHHTDTTEIGAGVRFWSPGWRLFAEPHLSRAIYSANEDDQQDHAGWGVGAVVGAEVVHGRHVSLDLLAGASRDFLADFDDEEHVWVALGGSLF